MAEAAKSEIQEDAKPDLGERLYIWHEQNQKIVTAILVALVLVVLSWRAYQFMHQRSVDASSAEYSVLLQNMDKGLTERDEAKRKDALRAAITDAERLSKDFNGSYIGNMSQLILGNAHYYLASSSSTTESQAALSAAQDAYKKYNSLSNMSDRDKAIGRLATGNLQEDLLVRTKDLQRIGEALEAYGEAQKLAPGTYIAAEAKLGEARVLQNSVDPKNYEKARKILDEVGTEFAVKLPKKEKAEERDRKYVTRTGREFSGEEIRKIQAFANVSYQKRAEDLQKQFKGM